MGPRLWSSSATNTRSVAFMVERKAWYLPFRRAPVSIAYCKQRGVRSGSSLFAICSASGFEPCVEAMPSHHMSFQLFPEAVGLFTLSAGSDSAAGCSADSAGCSGSAAGCSAGSAGCSGSADSGCSGTGPIPLCLKKAHILMAYMILVVLVLVVVLVEVHGEIPPEFICGFPAGVVCPVPAVSFQASFCLLDGKSKRLQRQPQWPQRCRRQLP